MNKAILLGIAFVACAVAKDSESKPSNLLANQKYLGSGSNRGKVFDNKDPEFTEAENGIIRDVFSPDYYEPTVVLDYRYLKSGGRGYVRSDGGQVLILPRRNHMPPPHNNYDTLLEFLRLKHLQKLSKVYLSDSGFNENYRKSVVENGNNYRNENIRKPQYYRPKLNQHNIEDEY